MWHNTGILFSLHCIDSSKFGILNENPFLQTNDKASEKLLSYGVYEIMIDFKRLCFW